VQQLHIPVLTGAPYSTTEQPHIQWLSIKGTWPEISSVRYGAPNSRTTSIAEETGSARKGIVAAADLRGRHRAPEEIPLTQLASGSDEPLAL
jgi:hypothetical protein